MSKSLNPWDMYNLKLYHYYNIPTCGKTILYMNYNSKIILSIFFVSLLAYIISYGKLTRIPACSYLTDTENGPLNCWIRTTTEKVSFGGHGPTHDLRLLGAYEWR